MKNLWVVISFSLLFTGAAFSSITPSNDHDPGLAHETSEGEHSTGEEMADHSAKKEFDILEVLGHHLNDSKLYDLKVQLPGSNTPLDISITKRVVMLWIVAALLILILLPAARKIAKDPSKKPSRFTGIIEVFVSFIRKN